MRGWFRHRPRAWTVLVSLLIVATLPTPLPRVEFHNVRHHDAPGQVCEYHDHLLRWHADASEADDVPVLHWHWGWLGQGEDDASHLGQTPRLHAFQVPDSPTSVDPGPAVVADPSQKGTVAPPFPSPLADDFLSTLTGAGWLPAPGARPPVCAAGSFLVPHVTLHVRLLRWTC